MSTELYLYAAIKIPVDYALRTGKPVSMGERVSPFDEERNVTISRNSSRKGMKAPRCSLARCLAIPRMPDSTNSS